MKSASKSVNRQLFTNIYLLCLDSIKKEYGDDTDTHTHIYIYIYITNLWQNNFISCMIYEDENDDTRIVMKCFV